MNRISVYSLDSFVPLYILKNNNIKIEDMTENVKEIFSVNVDWQTIKSNIKQDIINDTNFFDIVPEWVKKNINKGNAGEIIAEKYLRSKYVNVERVSLKSSSFGYDIKADDQVYEIKTSTSNNFTFNITFNELKKANELCDEYHIFYIKYVKNEKSIKGYIIDNPIKMLNLNFKSLTNIIDNVNSVVVPNTFLIRVQESLIDKLEEINLNYFCYQ